MKNITEKLLRIDNHACVEGYQWWVDNKKPSDGKQTLKKLISGDHNDWANWLIVRLMSREHKIKYAIYAAEQVISIYEAKYPNDDRPRKAIQAAKNYLKNKSTKNKNVAYAATDAVANAVVNAAAYAAYAANAAAYAAYAAYAATDAVANAAANAAAYAAADAAAKKVMQIKILKYGMKLLTVK